MAGELAREAEGGKGTGMNYWFWVGVQLVCVIVNGILILFNYANYLKYQKKMFVGLMAASSFWLLWSMVWCVWDVGKATGKW